MATMNISLPDSLKGFVDAQIESRGYGSSSEYVRDLIRREQVRQELRELFLEGARSPLGPPVDKAFFEDLRGIAQGKKKHTPSASSLRATRP
jgi:antitoxin ParD1/3/4